MIMPQPVVLQPGENYTENKEWNLYIYFNGGFVPPQAGSYGMRIPDPFLQGMFVPITIVPEIPSFLNLLLSIMAALPAVIVYKKKRPEPVER